MPRAKIEREIDSCFKCPHAKISKVYTSDCWDEVLKVHCELLKEDVHEYLEWRDKADVPQCCPIIVKESNKVRAIKLNNGDVVSIDGKLYEFEDSLLFEVVEDSSNTFIYKDMIRFNPQYKRTGKSFTHEEINSGKHKEEG